MGLDAVDGNPVHQSYTRSPEVYDLVYGAGIGKDYSAEARRLDEIIRGANPDAQTLLDVGCGTGLHLQQMVARGYTVEGVDLSPAMVAVASDRLTGVAVTVADMRTLNLGRRFDAVTCLFSTIGYLLDPSEMREAFAAMAAHLNPGGVLIVDGWIRPEDWRPREIPQVESVENDQMRVVRINRSWRDGDITRLDMHHLVATRDSVEYFVEHHDVALMSTADYVAAARAASLEVSVERDYLPDRDRIIGTRSRG